MNTTAEVVQLACSLWPAWRPTRDQLDEWTRTLSGMTVRTAEAAVRTAYRRSKWREPRLSAVLEAADSDTNAGRVANRIDVAERNRIAEAADEAASRRDHDRMTTELESLPLAVLFAALDAGAEAWGCPHWRTLTEQPVREWPRLAVGMAWAASKSPLPIGGAS